MYYAGGYKRGSVDESIPELAGCPLSLRSNADRMSSRRAIISAVHARRSACQTDGTLSVTPDAWLMRMATVAIPGTAMPGAHQLLLALAVLAHGGQLVAPADCLPRSVASPGPALAA